MRALRTLIAGAAAGAAMLALAASPALADPPARVTPRYYDVVRYSTSTRDHIPANLEPFFASASARVKGWFCTAKTARSDITDYGFLTTPFCGSVS